MTATPSKQNYQNRNSAIGLLLLLISCISFAPLSSLAQNDQDPPVNADDANAESSGDLTRKRQQAIADALAHPELVWLNESDDAFLGLARPALEPTQMALLLLSDKTDALKHPNRLKQLYRDLPDHGWSTLHTSLPSLLGKPTPIPPRAFGAGGKINTDTSGAQDGDDKTDENSDADLDTEDSLAKQAAKRIEISHQYLRDNFQSAAVTLIATDGTAEQAIAAAIAEQAFVSGLVLLNVDRDKLDAKQLSALVKAG